MEKKDIEIPFGAFDSELGGFEYTIPEGYKAEIKDGKIVVRKTESEDERIRKALLNEFIHLQSKGYKFAGLEGEEIIAWLEKQGEKAKYHDICDKCVRQPMCQSDCFLQQDEQKPVEWNNDDEYYRNIIIKRLEFEFSITSFDVEYRRQLENALNWLKSLRFQSQWKPSKEQMNALYKLLNCSTSGWDFNSLESLYKQLKKLREELLCQ